MWRAESKIDQIGLFGKILAKNETYYLLSNPIKGEFKKGHIDQQTFSRNLRLLCVPELLDVLDDLERRILCLQPLLLRLKLLPFLAKRPRQNILERCRVKQVHNFLLRQRLLHEETEEDGITELPEVVEELGPSVRILHDVLKCGLVVAENAGGAVIVPAKNSELCQVTGERPSNRPLLEQDTSQNLIK